MIRFNYWMKYLKYKVCWVWRLGLIDKDTAFRWEVDWLLSDLSQPAEKLK